MSSTKHKTKKSKPQTKKEQFTIKYNTKRDKTLLDIIKNNVNEIPPSVIIKTVDTCIPDIPGIMTAYMYAKNKHEFFADIFTRNSKDKIRSFLKKIRELNEKNEKNKTKISAEDIFFEEFLEALMAYKTGNLNGCLVELNHSIAVLLRTKEMIKKEIIKKTHAKKDSEEIRINKVEINPVLSRS